jgi:hypothetical protein
MPAVPPVPAASIPATPMPPAPAPVPPIGVVVPPAVPPVPGGTVTPIPAVPGGTPVPPMLPARPMAPALPVTGPGGAIMKGVSGSLEQPAATSDKPISVGSRHDCFARCAPVASVRIMSTTLSPTRAKATQVSR